MQDGLDFVGLFADAPDGSAFAVHGPPGDEVSGDGSQAEEGLELVGDGGVLAVEDLDVGQVEQVLGDGDGLGAGVAGGEQVGGFVGDGELDVAVAAGQAQVGVEALDGLRPEPQLLPGLVADDDAQVAGVGGFAHGAAPGVEAGQGDADGVVTEGLEPGEAQGLDGGVPVDVDGGVVVEQAGQGPGDELAEGVAQEPGVVEELLPAGVPAFGDEGVGGRIERLPQLGDGDLPQPALPVGVAGEVGEGGLDDDLVGGPERDPGVAEALAADVAADQGEPAGEDHRGPGLCGRGVEVLPALAEGAEREGVDPGGQAVADGEGLDAEGVAELLVLVLGVAEDEGAVAELHHPQHERLDGCTLAAAGFAEGEDVGVGDGHVVAQDPAERVGVEAATGELVDAHLRAGRRQPGGGDERPQDGRLVGGHPPRRHGGVRGGPAASGMPLTPLGRVAEQSRVAPVVCGLG
ncbi:MAG: hypothetical protein L0H79_19770 [Intrasporangium sp.]|uniref:hypothetical protein n=1 Tax=Intrasporangium sp. TaxID=1925024 RepID=UPI002647474C|nr:hypothetical protein [Intrasporangium sp.]MDN5797964.1 hypothetical protein [Intrasporangium sp.]